MQDSCNLAWKLALVIEGGCSSELLSTYDGERRPVAREMISETSKLSAVMTVRNPLLQSVRNHAIALLLGLPAVRHALADRLSEITIGYPVSALTRSDGWANAGPRPGARAPSRPGEQPAGAGGPARYSLFAESDEYARRFVEDHSALVARDVRVPYATDSMWLVRPDGYVGVVAKADDWNALGTYLRDVAGREIVSHRA